MSDPASRGRFIVFEGSDGSGKSTQAELLAARLRALLTREPGGTALGESVREMLLHSEVPVDARAEALLFAADRAQHVHEVVEPALAAGRDVVSDRYVYSSIAYQGAGHGLGQDAVAELGRFATGGLEPDLVLLLELDEDTRISRVGAVPDRIESRDSDFGERVREAFVTMAERDPGRWVTVDGSGSVAEIADEVYSVVQARLGPGTLS